MYFVSNKIKFIKHNAISEGHYYSDEEGHYLLLIVFHIEIIDGDNYIVFHYKKMLTFKDKQENFTYKEKSKVPAIEIEQDLEWQ